MFKKNPRLKVLLIILGLSAVGLAIILYLYWPFVDAANKLSNRNISVSLTALPISVKANNIDQAKLTATLSCGSRYATKGVTVNFTTTLGTLTAASAVTNTNCQAVAYLKSSQIGSAQVKAQYSTASATTNVSFTDPASTSMFSDDFSGTLAKWTQVYNGYGTIAVENGELSMAPKASTQPTETHAPLVIAGESTWKDYIFESRMKTVGQLRTGSTPNAWEVGWLIFRYTNENSFYYFIHKPNGIELGKEITNSSGQQDQQYLVTKTTPTLTLGQWNNYKIVLKGANIKVYINNTLVADYTDTNNPYLTGKIGLYNEDAHVHYDDVRVTAN